MNKRITLITLFEESIKSKIQEMINLTNVKACKVPYGVTLDDRVKVDTLPYQHGMNYIKMKL